MQFILDLFNNSDLMPHGHWLLWNPYLIVLHAGSDLIIAAAYLSIPLAIYKVISKREDFRHRGIGTLFGLFILACAVTHILSFSTIWLPAYWLHGVIKAFCATISGVTAIVVWRILPDLISMPGPEHLTQANKELRAEITRRKDVESRLLRMHEELFKSNQLLESRVARRTADLQAANEELEDFAYVASHDLRSPLRPLMIIPKWIRSNLTQAYGEIRPEIENDLWELERQSKRMDTLLSDLLNYARIGRKEDMTQKIRPVPLIRECVAMAGVPDGFDVHIPEDLPPIECVPTEFNLVVRNLISNAVKHHDKDKGSIIISGVIEDDQLVLSIADDGPGIDPKYAAVVFEMFATLKPKDEVEGSGIGLSMAKKIMDRMGGSVRFYPNSAGRGTVFNLIFPQQKVPM